MARSIKVGDFLQCGYARQNSSVSSAQDVRLDQKEKLSLLRLGPASIRVGTCIQLGHSHGEGRSNHVIVVVKINIVVALIVAVILI